MKLRWFIYIRCVEKFLFGFYFLFVSNLLEKMAKKCWYYLLNKSVVKNGYIGVHFSICRDDQNLFQSLLMCSNIFHHFSKIKGKVEYTSETMVEQFSYGQFAYETIGFSGREFNKYLCGTKLEWDEKLYNFFRWHFKLTEAMHIWNL